MAVVRGNIMSEQGGEENTEQLNAMLTLYSELRTEVNQSIQFQNRIILSEAVVIALVYAIEVTPLIGSSNSSSNGPLMTLAGIVLPPVVIISTALWVAEQSRMMRIGDYLELLENKINSEFGEACLSWENWLRTGGVTFVGHIHHAAKAIGYVGLFIFLGIVSLGLYIKNIIIATGFSNEIVSLLQILLLAVYTLLFSFLIMMTIPILDYGRGKERKKLGEQLPDGQRWRLDLDSTAENNSYQLMTDGEGEEKWGDKHRDFKRWEKHYKEEVLGASSRAEISNTQENYNRGTGWWEWVLFWK